MVKYESPAIEKLHVKNESFYYKRTISSQNDLDFSALWLIGAKQMAKVLMVFLSLFPVLPSSGISPCGWTALSGDA